MIRFVDLGQQLAADENDPYYPREFSFYDTDDGSFLSFGGSQAFTSIDDFLEAAGAETDAVYVLQLSRLIPAWARHIPDRREKQKGRKGTRLLTRIREFLRYPDHRIVIEKDSTEVVYGPRDVGRFTDADKVGVYVGDDFGQRIPCCFVHFATVVLRYDFKCYNCGKEWHGERIPVVCPFCLSRVWNGRDDSKEDRRRGTWTRVRVGGSAEVSNG